MWLFTVLGKLRRRRMNARANEHFTQGQEAMTMRYRGYEMTRPGRAD